MDRSPEEELAELGDKLRKTLSMARPGSRAQSESMMKEDVNRGMSHLQNDGRNKNDKKQHFKLVIFAPYYYYYYLRPLSS
jgi:hypothetical protein